jgi:YVTN family beta-propeller protein
MVIVDLVNPSIVASFNFFGDSLLPVISPDGRTAYIATVDNVEVIDVATATHITSISDFGQIPSLAVRPDGAEVWAVNSGADAVRIIDPASNAIAGSIDVGHNPTSISFSADGSKAFVIITGDDVVDVIDTGSKQIIDQIAVPDNSLSIGGFIASAPPASPLAAAVLPGGRSVQAGSTATVFATLINGGANSLNGCGIQLPISATDLGFDYQTTDPATNALIGAPNTPVSIGAGSYQTYVLSFNSNSAESFSNLPLVFDCADVTPAAVTTGVNTVDLLFSSVPVPDVIALAATVSGDGVVTVPFSQNGAAAFAVASVNAGTTGALNVVTDTGDASLPLDVSVCQTNPSTGQCLAPPSSTLPVVIDADETPTFSFFVTARGDIPFAPGTSRIFVRFLDATNVSHGSTSVAVTTN